MCCGAGVVDGGYLHRQETALCEEKNTIYDNLMDVLLLAAYLVLLFGSFVAVALFWSF